MLFEKPIKEGTVIYPYFSDYVEEDSDVYSKDLLELRKEYIKGMTVDMIEQVIVVDSYQDDHEECLDIELIMKDGNEIVFAAMWIVSEFVADIYAAAKYNVTEAKQQIIDYLKSFLEEDII